MAVALVAAACTPSRRPSTSATTVPTKVGPVDVLYDASLAALMTTGIGPGFHATTGYAFEGFAAPSSRLAAQITGRSRSGDVFIGEGTAADEDLMGAADGGWVSWYATFARSSSATYTVTVLNGANDASAGQAFVRYLLGPQGMAALASAGVRRVAPTVVVGTGIPNDVATVLDAGETVVPTTAR
jgi:ABC-type molybdate transport system substrate-binding protein